MKRILALAFWALGARESLTGGRHRIILGMVWAEVREGLTQLLHDPLRGRMSSDVEVEHLAAAALDREEAVQQLEH
jgi:hypothetical protein